MYKIAFFETAAWEKDWLVKNLGGFALKFYDGPLDALHVPPERDFAAVVIGEGSRAQAEVLAAFPHLELIAVRSQHAIRLDLAYCRRRGVFVCRIPEYAVHAVAEFTFAVLLALMRKLPDAWERGKASREDTSGLQGTDLWGKTLGVLGTGRIGSHVIRIAKGFGMQVLAWSAKQNMQLASELGFTYVQFESLCRHADVITAHLPYSGHTGSTHHLLNRELLSHCRQHALLINTAHPNVMDTDAIWNMLQNGTLGGFALDAAPNTLPEKFFAHPKVIITPRIAYHSYETQEHILRATAENLRAYFRGFPLPHC